MGNGSVKPAYNVGKYPVTQSGVKRFSPFQPNLNEFPTPSFLRDENVRFAEWHAAYPYATHAYDLECLPDDIKKSDLFQKENYAHIDAHALQAPPGLVQATPHGAVKYLIKICSTDLEKVHVLFVWTCSLDPYGTEGMAVNGSVKEILLSIKKCLKRLNDLFHQLCVWAGLHVQEVKGIGKSNVFTGDNIVWSSDGEVGVTTVWVAVEIQGCWRFIDIHMASYNLWCRQNGLQQYHGDWELLDDNDQGYKRIDDKPVELHHEINEFFFLTDPHEFIYTHYPDEPKWQLLARQVTYLEFMNLAPLESYFFDLGLEMMNAKSLNVVVQGKETVLKFGIPDPKKNAMYYMWRKTPLWYYLEPTRQYIKFEKHEKELWCKAPPGLVQATPHGAVKYLIKICSTDLEKVRVLFVWTCSLDPYGTEGMAVNGSVKEILLSIKKCLKRLNDLFHQLCVWAGLHVQEVKGIGKSNVFTGDNIVWSSDGEVGVTTVWVAVEIQGCWRFIDIHMASYNLWCRQNGLQQYHGDWELLDDNDQGYKRIDDKPVELHHEINEFFFLTDPHEFIYTHYPDEPKWQLLARQVTYLEFMNLAPLESYFFDLGLEMMNAKSLNVVVQGKETVLKFGIPDPKKNAMYYMWRKTPLWYYLEPTRQYIKFEKHEKELWCKVSVPTSGKYKVRLYLENSSNEYLPCATYTLHCTVN